MYTITKNDGDTAYGIKEFALDSIADLETLPRCEMGSVAIVIDSGEVYMKNSAGKWVKL